MARRAALPSIIFALCALLYVLSLGKRAFAPSPDNHYVHLADSILHGQLSVLGNEPKGTNDWALYRGTWYVSFPPFPALVILPAVAIWHTATLDRLFWALVAGIAPALLFVLLRRLSERGASARSERENLLLTVLFAFGTVYFFVAVQGTVWFAAHVVASALLVSYALFSLDAARPTWAGTMLGLAFLTRPPTALAGVLFVIEALRVHRRTAASDLVRQFGSPFRVPNSSDSGGVAATRPGTPPSTEDASAEVHPLRAAFEFVRGANLGQVARVGLAFAAPVVALLAVQAWMNAARFDDPLTFGHEYLQIRWKTRIERYGLFDYHYLSKNLAVFLASLPWFASEAPYLKVSLHGLALWFTTPNLLWTLWPKHIDARMVGLYLASGSIALLDLTYQNSGWVQFGYRFALDYLPFLIVLVALGRRRFGPGFMLCALLAVAINAFGAATFDRTWKYYDNDKTQNRVFQPD